ncbi:hypothetical protein H4582DRAFT_491991 [Lactarius indigo]|nr:hypothetical protein H4582DRAFT_491991 [Lactarius indigo]
MPTMPASFPVDDFHGALLIGTVLSSILYGVTWSQVYSYYSSHCSRDRWPLKSFVAFMMIQAAVVISTVVLEVSVQNFYAYRIYCLSWHSPYLPAAINLVSGSFTVQKS